MAQSLTAWYKELPPVTRCYLTAAVCITALCYFEILTLFHLYLDFKLIASKWQWWRLVTTFLFFGDSISIDFLFHMYFLVRYSTSLEQGAFWGASASASFFWMLLFGSSCMLCIAPFVKIPFLSHSLTFMMVYVYGRRNEGVRMTFLHLFTFRAPYLPWVLLGFSFLLGSFSPGVDLLGILVGHIYIFFQDVAPNMPNSILKDRRLLDTPVIIRFLFGEAQFRLAPRQANANNLNNLAAAHDPAAHDPAAHEHIE
jgi:Derlin-2/3